jgi:Cdc6-like AAA superfamily ATPase
MDAIKNPFSPGAGSPPPELVGREGILEQARILLGRVKEKRPEKSILLTGLRGVGKTVLLNGIAPPPHPSRCKLFQAPRRP